MTTIRKTAAGKVAGSLSYVLSDDTVDRMGDVIEAGGWDLKWFKLNPIALFNHNPNAPIGKWRNVRVDGGKLIAELEPAQRGTSQRVDEIISLIEQNILRATSVGFMPIDSEPLDKNNPYGGQRFKKQQLLETSIVSVPANPAALQLAKSLSISEETMNLAFGEHAETRRRDMTKAGEHAETKTANGKRPSGSLTLPKVNQVTNRSERIQDIQQGLVEKNNKRDAIECADTLDVEALEQINIDIETAERALAALTAAEAKVGARAAGGGGMLMTTNGSSEKQAAPAIHRRPLGFPQKEVSPLDLLVRSAIVNGTAWFGNKSI